PFSHSGTPPHTISQFEHARPEMKAPRAKGRQGGGVYPHRPLGCQIEKRQDAPPNALANPARAAAPRRQENARPMKPKHARRPGRPYGRDGHRNRRDAHAARGPRAADDDRVQLYGVHAVEAALRNQGRKVLRLLLTENAENRLAEAVAARQAAVERVSPRDL